jgi:hypothetical protein
VNLSQCSAPEDSPWIRGAPQSGVPPFICRIILRISRSSDGRLISNASPKQAQAPIVPWDDGSQACPAALGSGNEAISDTRPTQKQSIGAGEPRTAAPLSPADV